MVQEAVGYAAEQLDEAEDAAQPVILEEETPAEAGNEITETAAEETAEAVEADIVPAEVTAVPESGFEDNLLPEETISAESAADTEKTVASIGFEPAKTYVAWLESDFEIDENGDYYCSTCNESIYNGDRLTVTYDDGSVVNYTFSEYRRELDQLL